MFVVVVVVVVLLTSSSSEVTLDVHASNILLHMQFFSTFYFQL